MKEDLVAPFPYFGGKRHVRELVWTRFGEVVTYLEPFAGGLAVLLGNPQPAKREIVGDTNAAICNFWRSVRTDPEQVARYASYPSIHQDLTSRHQWMTNWFAENHARFAEDPDYYDLKVAGWWLHGMCLWIGGNFCDYSNATPVHDKTPKTPSDIIPHMSAGTGGQGINAQRTVPDIIPMLNSGAGGRGTSSQRGALLTDTTLGRECAHLQRTLQWMQTLADRLFSVVVLNRSWESVVTPIMQGDRGPVAVFLDPPYATESRSTVYASDRAGSSDDAATNAYEWAIEHGGTLRIGYCCHAGDFPVPDGWTAHESGLRGIRKIDRREARPDLVMFSPACLDPVTPQGDLFD